MNTRSAGEQKQGPARQALVDEGARRLAAAGIQNARREAEWLLAARLETSRALLYARAHRPVPHEEARRYRAQLGRRAGGEPLQYVLGHADFYGLRLKVSPAVLIPRPETENVVEAALRRLRAVQHPRVLDVGTGSGCIALAFKAERPEAEVWACDVSPEALAVARANARACDLDVCFFQANVLAEPGAGVWPTGLDLLISNPPYIPDREAETLPASVRAHEPGVALFSGEDPLRFYRVLARRARRLLAPGGLLVLETHDAYAGDVAALLREEGLREVTTQRDTFGRARMACGTAPLANAPGEHA